MSYVLRFMFRDLREVVRDQGWVSYGGVVIPQKRVLMLTEISEKKANYNDLLDYYVAFYLVTLWTFLWYSCTFYGISGRKICGSPYNSVSLRAQLNRGESREAVLPITEKKRYNECLT